MKIGILGTGAYGIGLAAVIRRGNHDITMWTKFEDEKKDFLDNRTNTKVLPMIKLEHDIKVTTSLSEAVNEKDIIIIAVPISFFRSTVEDLKQHYNHKSIICIATKGIEEKTSKCANMLVEECLETENIAVISGPTFAIDLANDTACSLTVATKSDEIFEKLEKVLVNENLKIEKSTDILGVELCGSFKNIMAIGSGILNGLGQSDSTRAMFLKDALCEMKTLLSNLGASEDTAYTYAGMGDLILTCNSVKSRNFTYGTKVGSKSKDLDEYVKNTTIEGLRTLEPVHKLIEGNQLDSKIIKAIYNICYLNKDSDELLEVLMKKEQ